MASRRKETQRPPRRNGPPLEVMQFWGTPLFLCPGKRMRRGSLLTGYKFETLATIPATWGETPRDYIEGRETQVVSNKEQYCSIVRTGIGKTILCLGGEVDASASRFPLAGHAVQLLTSLQFGIPSPKSPTSPSTGLSSRRRPRSATPATSTPSTASS